MSYHEIVDCVWRGEERWHLEDVVDAGGEELTWEFCRSIPVACKVGLRTRVYEDGPPVDLTIAGLATPILSPRALDILRPALSEFCELLPVTIEDQPPGYAILNVLRAEDCVDEEASELMIWTADSARPDKAGEYRQITKLVLKRGLVLPPLFSLRKSKTKLFVSDTIAKLFLRHRLSGVMLEER